MPYRATSGVKPKGGVFSFILEGLRLKGGKRGHLIFRRAKERGFHNKRESKHKGEMLVV